MRRRLIRAKVVEPVCFCVHSPPLIPETGTPIQFQAAQWNFSMHDGVKLLGLVEPVSAARTSPTHNEAKIWMVHENMRRIWNPSLLKVLSHVLRVVSLQLLKHFKVFSMLFCTDFFCLLFYNFQIIIILFVKPIQFSLFIQRQSKNMSSLKALYKE